MPTSLFELLKTERFQPPEWMETIKVSRKPFNHQIGDIQFLRGELRSGLLNEPGVGKTLSMQAHGIYLAALGNKSIYTMPPILVKQFIAAMRMNFPGIDSFLKIEELSGTPLKRANTLKRWDSEGYPDFMCMSYQMFVQYQQDLKENHGYTNVYVDEATVVKNPSSKVHLAVESFIAKGNGLVLITGTPIETNIEDAYGIIKLLDPTIYQNRYVFDDYHCIKEQIFIGLDSVGNAKTAYKTVGYRNLDMLHANLMKHSRRVLKKDVSDLPPRLISEYLVDLGTKHHNLYCELVEERMLELEDDTLIDVTTAQALYQATQQVLLNPEKYGANIKNNELLDTLDEIIESLGSKKILVYCWYQESITKLVERYKHLNPVALNGEVTGDKREKAKAQFISDPECKMLIANPKSGGVGVDGLQHVCSHVVYAEVCPFVGTFQQSIDRLHRTGQKAESVNVYILVANNTIAVDLRNRLVEKDANQEKVVKDKRTILAELMGSGGIQGSFDEIV